MEYSYDNVLRENETLDLFQKYPQPGPINNAFVNLLKKSKIIDWPIQSHDHSIEAHMIHLNWMRRSQDIVWHTGDDNIIGNRTIPLYEGSKLNRINIPAEFNEERKFIKSIVSRSRDTLNLLSYFNGIQEFNSFENLKLPDNVSYTVDMIKIKNLIIDEAVQNATTNETVNLDIFTSEIKKLNTHYKNSLEFN